MLVARGTKNGLFQPVLEQATIGQLGEHIVESQMTIAFLTLHPAGDVAGNTVIANEMPGIVKQRIAAHRQPALLQDHA